MLVPSSLENIIVFCCFLDCFLSSLIYRTPNFCFQPSNQIIGFVKGLCI